MFGLLSAIAVTAGLSASPPGAPAAHSTSHEAHSAAPPTPRSSVAGYEAGAGAGTAASDAYLARSNFLGFVGTGPGSSAGAAPGSDHSGTGTGSGGQPGHRRRPHRRKSPSPPSPTQPDPSQPDPSQANTAASGAGGPGVAGPTSGASGDCNISVTDLTSALSVTCTTGDSGSVVGVGSGGDSGAVTITPATGSGPSASAAGGALEPGRRGHGRGWGLDRDCHAGNPRQLCVDHLQRRGGAVGELHTGHGRVGRRDRLRWLPRPRHRRRPTRGSSAGAGAGASGASGDSPDVASSGSGGSATTRVTTGRTGNCIIHLVNIRAALTVICITGGSGGASGDSFGGRSGSATLLAAGSGGGAAGAQVQAQDRVSRRAVPAALRWP